MNQLNINLKQILGTNEMYGFLYIQCHITHLWSC